MLTSSCIVIAKDPSRRRRYPDIETYLAPSERSNIAEQRRFRHSEKMGSGLSVVVNVIQILSFGVQLVQAGPDLLGFVPAFVRKVCRITRERMSESDNGMMLSP